MLDEIIKMIIQRTGIDQTKAEELAKSLQPAIAKKIISERPATIYIDYIQNIFKRTVKTKKGEQLLIESFLLADRRISVFHREQDIDNSSLIGTRQCFLITKQNNFNGRVDYSGVLLNQEQVLEIFGTYLNKPLNGSKPTAKPISIVGKG